jgi:cyclase
MNKIRVIARIDVKNEFVIKGIHLEGLRKVGDPNILAKKYYEDGIDEIVFMDAVAAYYDRNSLSHIIEKACEEVFIPITVGGGLRTIEDINQALKSGADKVAINTKAIQTPEFITEASKIFGSQCIVASIVAKKTDSNKWEAYIDNGREPTGLDVVEWAKKLEELGAGEIMLTSLDMEGTKKGFDIELYQAIQNIVSIPIIASGGMGSAKHGVDLLTCTNVDAIATASVIHYNIDTIQNIKKSFIDNDIKVRV